MAVFLAVASACGSSEDAPFNAPTPSRLPSPIPAPAVQLSTSVPVSVGQADIVVIYGAEGFIPKRVEIELGQVVAFVNESDNHMWPASNIHPTHEIYPAFDSMAPIDPGGSWLFYFEQGGFWRYHNHMAPSASGLVVVRGGATAEVVAPLSVNPQQLSFEELGTVSVEDAVNLFRDDALLASYVEKYGPASTVALLSEYESQVGDCHERAHVMGRIAYEYFGAPAFSLSGHECHSGGYHGATEAFFRDRGTANLHPDIEVICGGSPNDFFRHQCLHGIGHGLMAWTSYEIFDALQLCDLLGEIVAQQSCYSGIFMENVVGGLSGSMGHFTEYLSDDPHFPCNILEDKYVSPCYFYQSSRMVQLFGSDFQKVSTACAEAPQVAHRVCFQSMGRDVGGITRGDPERAIQLCAYSEDPENRLNCLVGAVQDSFWDAGGANDALAFCQLLIGQNEKWNCYWTIVARAKDIYPTLPELQAFCAKVEEGYRQGCP